MIAYAYTHPWVGMAAFAVALVVLMAFVAVLSSGGRDG